MDISQRRFVTPTEVIRSVSPWTNEEWLCRSDMVANEELLTVRATMEPGRCHAFHTHPTREEIIYVISGKVEQWVGKEHRVLGPGEVAFIPKGEVHGSYNPFAEPLVFLAILASAGAGGPDVVDVSTRGALGLAAQGISNLYVG